MNDLFNTKYDSKNNQKEGVGFQSAMIIKNNKYSGIPLVHNELEEPGSDYFRASV